METITYISHHGILGQKWGVRRYQNPDGSLTEAGKKRYFNSDGTMNFKGRYKYGKELSREKKAMLDRETERLSKKYKLDSSKATIEDFEERHSQSLYSNNNDIETRAIRARQLDLYKDLGNLQDRISIEASKNVESMFEKKYGDKGVGALNTYEVTSGAAALAAISAVELALIYTLIK